MAGVFARGSAVVGFAFATACAQHHADTALTAPVPAKPTATPMPVYRFVSLGLTSADQQALDDGRIGLITWGAPGRAIVNSDGSVDLPPDTTDRLMGGVPVPARLGGGFLFWENALYWARSFGAPLEPLTALPTNAIGIEFGPDYVLLLLAGERPRAFALNPPRPTRLSPKGVIDVAAADDGRAVARDAAGRALFSTDAGKTWKDVRSVLSARVGGVREADNEVGFELGRKRAWLQSDGQFVTRALSEQPRTTPSRSRTGERLRRAIADGLALPGMRAWVGEGPGTLSVDLRTGDATPVKVAGPEGSNCVPVSLDDEGVVMCTLYTMKPTTTVISHALGAAPVVEKTFQGSPQFVKSFSLSVLASCSGAPAEDAACVRRAGGAWVELKVSAELSKTWQPFFWLPREAGGVSLLALERNQSGEPKVGLIDLITHRVTPWTSESGQSAPSLSPYQTSLSVQTDGSVRGFTSTASISVDSNGRVTRALHEFTAISSAGPHALARDVVEHLWQTNDYGAHWVEIARPPFDTSPEVSSAKVNPRPTGRATGIACSSMGCVLEHPAGTGFWLRLGWPEDPPKSAEPNATTAGGSAARAIGQPATSEPVLPKLRCVTRSGGPLRVTTLPGKPTDAQFVEPFDPQGHVHRFVVPSSPAHSDRFDRDSEPFERAVLSAQPGHAGGVLLRSGTLTLLVSNNGQARPIHPECATLSGYADARGKNFLACDDEEASVYVEALQTPSRPLVRAPVAAHFRESTPGLRFFAPGESLFSNPDSLAVGPDGKPSILRLPPGDEPPASDNPAWILSADAAPIELAPWSTLELATTPACAHADGYRAIVQNVKPWIEISGSTEHRDNTMTALVNWSAERVCLEAVELGFTSIVQEGSLPLRVAAVARFAGARPGAAFVGTQGAASVREPANCEFATH